MPTSNSDDPPSPSLSTRQSITYRSAPKVLLAGAVLTTLTILGLWIFALSPPDRRICPTDYQPYVGTQFDSSSITRINGPIQKFQYWMQSRLIVGPDKVPEMCFIPYRGIHATALRPPGPLQVNPDAILLSDQHDIRELNETYQYTVINLLLGIFFGTSLLLTMRLWQRRLEITEKGICFPPGMTLDLEWRRTREWSDISAIGLSGDGEAVPYELQIYFSTGGIASIHLDRLSTGDRERLFNALDLYSPALRSPEYVAYRHRHLNSSCNQTFTQMWEEELNSHFASTNFVALSAGAKLKNGKLKVAMHLSSGGLSAVYLAEKGKQIVVLKESVVPLGTSDENRAKAQELFKREATMLMKFDHPKIARVLDCFQENQRDYLLLEYIPGITLREYVHRHGAQSEQTVKAWALQIADILKYLHDHDPPVIHRDLTPDNLIITPSNDIVLIDFGAANQFLGTATGTIIGKQYYISPEQFRGKAEPSSDIYSFGGTMHFLLTGKDPEALSQSRPQEITQRISDEMNDLVAKCTNPESKDRIRTCAELIANLQQDFASKSLVKEDFEPVTISLKQAEKQAL